MGEMVGLDSGLFLHCDKNPAQSLVAREEEAHKSHIVPWTNRGSTYPPCNTEPTLFYIFNTTYQQRGRLFFLPWHRLHHYHSREDLRPLRQICRRHRCSWASPASPRLHSPLGGTCARTDRGGSGCDPYNRGCCCYYTVYGSLGCTDRHEVVNSRRRMGSERAKHQVQCSQMRSGVGLKPRLRRCRHVCNMRHRS